METLVGKRVLVTGAGQRVGASIAACLGAQGARVALHCHQSVDGASQLAKELQDAGGEAFLLRADLRDPVACTTLVRSAAAHWGGALDLLVSSAANFLPGGLAADETASQLPTAPTAGQDDVLRASLQLNVEAPWHLARAAAPWLRASRGSMVFVTCTSTRHPYAGYPAYIVSKGALAAMMRVLALELAPEVRVNAVAPGTVLPPPGLDAEAQASLAGDCLLERVGRAEDIAQAVSYLATASFVTGQEVFVNGGTRFSFAT